MKPHISSILKPGAKLNTVIPKENEKLVYELIQKTIEQQKKVIALAKIDYEKLRNTYITI